jgi:hypothetical protein
MEGDESLAAELNEMIPNLFGWMDHTIIRFRAADSRMAVNVWTPVVNQFEEIIMEEQERRMAF